MILEAGLKELGRHQEERKCQHRLCAMPSVLNSARPLGGWGIYLLAAVPQ